MSQVLRTPLYDEHVKLGATMVEFAGYEMPIQYAGIIEEHKACRTAAGLFDVSHMGEIEIEGPDAERFVSYVSTWDASLLETGEVKYAELLYPQGTVVDDFFIYRESASRFLLVVNAANYDKDLVWVAGHKLGDVTVTGATEKYAEVALQGPKAEEILQGLTPADVVNLGYFRFLETTVCGRKAIVSRTGYTGEDGYEIYFAPEDAIFLWNAILDAGKPLGLEPTGLGARDTLRFEVCYWLYGHDLSDTVTPLEAGQNFLISWDHDFIGKPALSRMKEQGVPRTWIGVKMNSRAIPRNGFECLTTGPGQQKKIGAVTSGNYCPTLGGSYALCLVDKGAVKVGDTVIIPIRGKSEEGVVVKRPFMVPNAGKKHAQE
jgi:aminomethyltransferase